jgi:hypothetical protein
VLKEKVTDFNLSMNSFSTLNEFKSSTNTEFAKVSVSTAFDSRISESYSTGTNIKTAYAKKSWTKSIGALTNKCLQEGDIDQMIRHLIKPDIITLCEKG